MGRIRAGLVSGVWVLLLFVAVFGVVLNVSVASGQSGTIYIKADGSIDPPTAPIITVDSITYTFTDNVNDSIVIERSNIVIDGNGSTLQGVEAQCGFWSVSENNVTIKNTNIKGCYGSGIYFVAGSYLTICGNNITNNGGSGIETWGTSSFNIFGNNITANGGANILMESFAYGASSLGNVTENYISGSQNGISLLGPSNMIYRNNIVANEIGIFIGDSYNAIFGNNITSNNVGIYLYCDWGGSSNNKIYHNNFVNNTSQVMRYSDIHIETNLWDDDYPSGGNFWSDHFGVDLNRGPFQNETGGDGIDDTPHVVDEYIQDRYPLVSPWPSGPLLHELKVDLNSPVIWPVNRSVLLEATVLNSEINSETNVAFYLYINGSIVNSTSISLLGASASYTINYIWTPAMESVYNLTAYAAPVPEEIYIENNHESKVAIIRHPTILKVPYDYVTIQGAINALSQPSMPEDMIQVSAGTYYENVVANKTLSLIGDGSDRTIIDGNNTGTSVAIKADSVLVTNFTIQNAHGYSGICLESVRNCDITRNRIKTNTHGIYLQYSSNNIISGNNITTNGQTGLYLEYSSENVISSNDLEANALEGLYFLLSDLNIISENNITLNKWAGAGLWGSSNNRFYHDNFINNTNQVLTNSANIWDDGYPSGGNYWSDYIGVDEKSGPIQDQPGSDGIGDTPYPVGDRYPLMNPWVAPFPVARFTYSRKCPCVDETITFDASASYDSDGKVEIYNWDFGDGNTTSVPTSATTHVYDVNGTYDISLTVTDNDGSNSSITTNTVRIRASGEPLTVDDDGPADFHTIQVAVDAAREYESIFVNSGTYNENVYLTKTGLTIIGESLSTTIINGGYGDVVTINASDVSLSNFTIQQPKYYGIGLNLKSAHNSQVLGNTITSGIYLLESSNNTMAGNNIDDVVTLSQSSNNSIVGNNIENGYYGIWLYSSSSNSISNNSITNSVYYGIVLYSSSSNRIFQNNFISNARQVSSDSVNVWDDGYPSGGNYWRDYVGIDEKSGPNQNQLGSDGIGDTSYIIDENNRDNYPFMNPIGPDQIPPATLNDYDGMWHTADFTINLTVSDVWSGVAETYYKVNNGPTKTVSADGHPHITTEGADNKLECWSVDKAGNEESHRILTGVKLDKSAPSGSIIINNGDIYTTSSSVILTLTATDVTSGVYQVRYGNNGAWDTELWEAFSPTKAWTTTPGDETRTVYFQIKDNAGLVSETYADTIVLDATIPNIETPTREPAGDVLPGQSVKVSANVTDALSQVKNVTLYYTTDNGTTWTDLPMNQTASNLYEDIIPGQDAGTTVRFKIVSYDNAGNNATLDGTESYCIYQVIPEFPSFLILILFMTTTLLAVIVHGRRGVKNRKTNSDDVT